MQVWNVLHAARWNTGRKNNAKNRHLRTIAQLCPARLYLRNWGMYRQFEKKLLNSNISSKCPQNMVNSGPVTAEINWGVCSPPANINGFRVFASLLHWRRSTKVNQTLHDVWLSPGLVHDVYIFGGSCPVREFCQLQNSLCVQVLLSSILSALLHALMIVSQTLRRSTESATYIRQGGHHVAHRPTF